MSTSRAVGIDLGTTYSVIARLDDSGRSAVVKNAEGELLTPSVVFFDESEIVVGKAAKHAVGTAAGRVAECVKREMGNKHFSQPINGKLLPPEVIQACILGKLKTDIAAVVGPEFKAVITVPAYFDEPRRKATADAGEMAGLDVLDIVNEPTAAALAFGEQLGYLLPSGEPREPMKVLVYDLGGGTFDVTVIHLAPGDIQTLATDGDVQLGGRDWDQLLADHAAETFKAQQQVDVREHPDTMARLMLEAEQAKHTLSSRTHAVIHVEHEGTSLNVNVTREQFQAMSEGLLERTVFTTRQVMTAAGLTWNDLSCVLLVGGSTRMPMVSAMIQRLSGVAPDRSINPDEAVARGAALFAGYQMSQALRSAPATFKVTDVNSHSLGLQGIGHDSHQRENIVVIPRNTPLPVQVTRQFTTQSANQKSIVVQVLEGESPRPELCSRIGRSVLRNLPAGLPKGYPVQVGFAYGTNGRLHVEAGLAGIEHKAVVELEREVGLSDTNVRRWHELFNSDEGPANVDRLLAEAMQISEDTPGGDTPPQKPPRSSPAPAATPSPAQPASPAAAADHGPDHGQLRQGHDGAMQDDGPPLDDVAIARRRQILQRVIFVGGHVMAATIGVVVGYLILCWFKPAADILGIFSR